MSEVYALEIRCNRCGATCSRRIETPTLAGLKGQAEKLEDIRGAHTRWIRIKDRHYCGTCRQIAEAEDRELRQAAGRRLQARENVAREQG